MANLLDYEKAVFARRINVGVGVLNAASLGGLGVDTNGVTILTGGAADATHLGGTRVESLVINTDETAIQNYFIYILTAGAVVIPLGVVNVPALAGFSGSIPSVDVLAGIGISLLGMKFDSAGKRYIDLPAGAQLKYSSLAAMTAAKKTYATAQGLDY